MSGNHLLPIYYNTNRLTPKRRKKKKVSEKELKLRLEHEKFLLRMGYDKNRKPLPPKTERLPIDVPPLVIEKPDVSKWEPCTVKKAKPTLDGYVIIGQAYNKGNLVVLSKSDSKDESTGKRR